MTSKRSEKQDEPSNRELAQLVLGLRAELAEIRKAQVTPPKDGRFAKGTAPQASPEPVTLEDKIRFALIEQPQSAQELAEALQASPSTTAAVLGKLEKAGVVAQTTKGRGQHRFALRPTAETSTEDRRKILVGLIMEHPKGHSDLLDILQMDEKQLEYDIIEIRRRQPVWWMNKGAGGRGRANIYWIRPDRLPPPPELDGRIAPTVRKKSQ